MGGRVSEYQFWDEKEQGHHGESQEDEEPLSRAHTAACVIEREGWGNHPQKRHTREGPKGHVCQPGPIAYQAKRKDRDQSRQKHEDCQVAVRASFTEGDVGMEKSSEHVTAHCSRNKKTRDRSDFPSDHGIGGPESWTKEGAGGNVQW